MSKNYTEADTKWMIEEYNKSPTLECVAKIAAKLRKRRKSVISKLSREGVYQKKVYLTKAGTLPIPKAELVKEIEETLGKTFFQLDKAPKNTLNELKESVVQLQCDFESLLNEFDNLSIRLEMYEHKYGNKP